MLWKGARTFTVKERPEGWGKLIEVTEKRDRFGLGYQLTQIKEGTRRVVKRESLTSNKHSPVLAISMLIKWQ